MDNRYKRLGKNTVLVFIGSAGSKIIGLLMLPFYTSYLSTTEYGISDLIATYASIMVSIISCCVADAIFIFPKNVDNENRKKYFTSGLLFIFVSILLWAIATLLIKQYIGSETIYANVWWIFAVSITMILQSYMQQFTRSIDKMMIFSAVGVVHVVCLAGFAFLLLPIYGLTGYLWSIVLSNFVAIFFTFFTSGAFGYINVNSFSRLHLIELLKYGIPLIPNSIMWWIVNGINRPIMEANIGLEAIGIYAVANKLPGIITMLFMIFSNAWSITMLEEFGKPDFNHFFNRTVRVLFFFISICTVFMIVGCQFIVRIFASPDYFDAWKYVPLLSIGVLFSCMSGLIGGVFAAEKKSKYFFYSSIWGAVASLLFTIIGVKFLGLTGVCLAVALSFLCMLIVRLIFAWKHINEFNIKYYVLMLVLLFIVCLSMMFSKTMIIVVCVAVIVLGIMYLLNRDEARGVLVLLKNKFIL